MLPTGDPARFAVTYDVQSNSQFIFCLNYEDAEGRARTISADPIDVEITPGGVDPDPQSNPGDAPRGGSVKFGSSSTFTILLAVASAALVSMFTLLLVTSLSARRHRRLKAAEQRQRRSKSAPPAARDRKPRPRPPLEKRQP